MNSSIKMTCLDCGAVLTLGGRCDTCGYSTCHCGNKYQYGSECSLCKLKVSKPEPECVTGIVNEDLNIEPFVYKRSFNF